MSAQSVPKLLTVEEYERIPDPPGGRYELHHGELVFVTSPVTRHKVLQRRLRKMLETAAESHGFIADTEYGYRPLAENEVWTADIVCFAESREDVAQKWLRGSPELVIEVKSPSNSKHELHDKAMTTLAGEGAVEFWIADPETASITVYSKAAGVRNYGAGESVPVPLLAISVEIDPLFANL